MDKKTRLKLDGVIVCEGKTDQARLQQLFDVSVITTNGSALNQRTINLIKAVAKKQPVILFLDPDVAGQKIRRQLEQHLDKYESCFIARKDMKPNSTKIGVAEATDAALIQALQQRQVFTKTTQPTLSWEQYLELNLNSKSKRLALCNKLHLSYFNHKQLFRKLNLLQLTFDQVCQLLK
ncbi:ribonuclease M5 [Mycoplasmoides pneumoniae]|uniref:Ribonuclease M5 n=4 Tax=Mycoplasmoides pneumoniae TaxID=2104 RepID=RNM5_MYCPN|nr:ribonuclease M5 [Mycoplasmoides pneumoniae]P75045.1 RecName: Full=Ribonuclease M5; AltName: Full=RNase M5; AltName: Full=Ribosomal RNA terminal maturase M5 [Mycoplasmoides pneumoniae M129]AAB95731.1 nucelotidyl transferase/polynicleotide cleavage-like protein [Mycoplasmoides pneumoniae M129]ADK86860.1 ribonuclease M5 [Mycoplasmoides pneumoniae FH]AGC04013.1 ribonuclease M5 [Mycoplasmoides pneumoniae M129-B7]ALA29950.1 ribonuclease M5 [Mycoplasmoides pneumoniae PI 1428]ALA30919.1 ribonuclea